MVSIDSMKEWRLGVERAPDGITKCDWEGGSRLMNRRSHCSPVMIQKSRKNGEVTSIILVPYCEQSIVKRVDAHRSTTMAPIELKAH